MSQLGSKLRSRLRIPVLFGRLYVPDGTGGTSTQCAPGPATWAEAGALAASKAAANADGTITLKTLRSFISLSSGAPKGRFRRDARWHRTPMCWAYAGRAETAISVPRPREAQQ